MSKKLLVVFLVTLMVVFSVSAMGGNESEEPQEMGELKNDDTIKEFSVVSYSGGDVNPPMEEWWIWEEYEKKTGIKINWIPISSAAAAEQKNLILASSDKPDAFWQIGFSTDELIRYGSEGTFVNLVPYLDEYAPNLTNTLESINGGMQSCIMPDGGMYSLPWVMNDLPQVNLRYWINKNWLDNLGLEIPGTIDEITAVFEAFKTQDANGNGDKNDEWPIYMQPSGVGMLEQQLTGSFGVGDNGLKALGEQYVANDDDSVDYLYTTEGMKEIWTLMSEWWDAGYFHPETFGTLEYEKWVTDGRVNDTVGLYSWVGSNYLYNDAYKDYAFITVLEGPDDKVVQSWTDHPVRGNSSFTITSACEAPGTLLGWADYFYGKEGSEFATLGTEGVTYVVDEEGKRRYIDEILNYEGGSQLGAFQYGLLVYGGGLPQLYADSSLLEESRMQDAEDFEGERFSYFLEDSIKYMPELLPGLVPTTAEAAESIALTTDMNAYITEARRNFVTGEWDIDSAEWDDYVDQMNKMGAERYAEIKQAQYDRFLAN